MISRYEHGGIMWVDLENPTADEIETVIAEFGIDPDLGQELRSPTAKPRINVFAEHAYAVFHFPASRHTHQKRISDEIDVLIGKKYLITVHYEPIAAIQDFARMIEAKILLTSEKGERLHGAHLFFGLAEHLYRQAEHELDAIESVIEKIESDIFSGKEREMVASISKTVRELLDYKRMLGSHARTLELLRHAAISLFGNALEAYFQGAAALHARTLERAETMSETLDELRETNMALLTTRQNEIMKNLTVIAFITFPLSFIANLFSMNTLFTPIVEHPHGFWIILVGMLTLAPVCFWYFKARKWF